MKDVLLDSNVVVALLDPRDSLHLRAKETQSHLPESDIQIVSDIAAGEVLSVLARRCEERKQDTFVALASQFRSDFPKDRLVWIAPEIPRLYPSIIELMIEQKGKLNFNDCLLVLWMQENDMERIVSFDADFDSIPSITRISS